MAAVWDTMAEPLESSGLVSVHAIRSCTVIHVPDLSDDPVFDMQDARRAELVEIEGVRSYLVVPLVKGDEAVGTINLYRREVQPFSDDEIALIETFAAQAVIAIENVRQFRELQTRLEREKASARILELISRSRDDDVPVFDAILESAARLCKSTMARLHLLEEGGQSRRLASHWGENLRSLSIGETMPMDKGHPISRTILEGRVIHVEDLARTDLYAAGDELFHRLVEEEGLRTLLTVPLLRGGTSFGCIALSRREVRPFDERDIALVETFAAQAVIAIENVRQFRALEQSNADLVQALERQTATAEVLDVISQSQSELQPVLDKIAATAAQLCRAHSAGVWRVADGWLRIAAHTTADPGLTEHFRQNPIPLDGDLSAARAIREARPVHIADVRSDPAMSTDPRSMRSGARTIMMVPMISPDGEPIGAIVVSRQEPQPFDGAEIALVETFADQAAIAVENVRLFTELETRLEREAATREILEVISRSRDDETPVFDVILGNVLRLSNSSDALLYMIADDGVTLIPSAVHGGNDAAWQRLLAQPPTLADKESSYTQAIERQEAVQILDLKDTERYRRGSHVRRLGVDELGMRTVLQVPLISKGRSIGLISANRTEVRAYSPDEIELLRTFAAQAVIAIENVRQFRALEDRTEEVQVQAEELRGLNATLEARVEAQVGEIERMGKLKRFLPSAVADAIVSSGSEAVLKSHRALLGILFCDMRGFTAFCETAEPEETIEVLQTYHEEMGRLIAEHEAGVDHRMGDGIMVLFNDPLPCEDPAGDAVRLAIAMRARMEELCRRWKRLGHRLGFGVGISLGYATVGMVGYEGRSEYTASGTAVNLAARLCDQAEDGEIQLSPRAFTAVEDDVVCEPAGVLDLKGLAAPVEVMKAVALR